MAQSNGMAGSTSKVVEAPLSTNDVDMKSLRTVKQCSVGSSYHILERWRVNRRLRSSALCGDNLFLSSIVALNADTGAYIGHYHRVRRAINCYPTMWEKMIGDGSCGGEFPKTPAS
jgi:hypothetical protein